MNQSLDVLSSVIPQLYYEADSGLVDILEQYYKWLDGEFVNVAQVRSADAEQYFVDKMLEEYAPGIEKTPDTNERLLIKYATELFRAKGTPRAIDLFFRLVYQVNADVSFPRDKLFEPSDAQYVIPRFVEVTKSSHINKFVHQYVTTSSGGKMYVEAAQRIGTRIILLVSDVDGPVDQGATIYTTPETRKQASTIVGSLSTVRVDASFRGFTPGERVTFQSASGKKAAGYISQTSSLGQQATFDLVSGGVGMTQYPEINISERTMRLSSVSTTGGTLFDIGEGVTQELYAGVISEEDGDTTVDDYSVGDTVTFKEVNGANTDSVVDVNVVAVESTIDAGVRLIIQSAAPSANVLASNFVDGFSGTATLTVTSIDAAANVVAPDTTVKLAFATNEAPFAIGDELYQFDGGVSGSGKIVYTPTANTIEVEVTSGEFVPGNPVYNSSNTQVLTPTDIEQFIGIDNITGKFYAGGDVSVGNTAATVDLVSGGSEAEFTVKSIRGSRVIFTPAPLDPAASEFYGNNYVFDGTVNQYAIPVGTIGQIALRSNGEGYDYPPIATVKQPTVAVSTFDVNVGSTEGYELNEYVQQTGIADGTFDVEVTDIDSLAKDQIVLHGAGATAVYSVVDYVNPATKTIGVRAIGGDQTWSSGEVIKSVDASGAEYAVGANTVASTSTTNIPTASGTIVAKTADTLTIASTETFTVGGTLTGKTSGNARDVVSIVDVSADYPNQGIATVKASLTRVQGTISKVVVQYTEPGFRDSEPVDILIDGNIVATGTAVTSAFGSFRPSFATPGSKPSGGHALFDGDYYQHLSYEVKTPVDIDKYPNNKRFLQVAGMKMFIHNEISSFSPSTVSASATVSVEDV